MLTYSRQPRFRPRDLNVLEGIASQSNATAPVLRFMIVPPLRQTTAASANMAFTESNELLGFGNMPISLG
jgi:hypothetical protein